MVNWEGLAKNLNASTTANYSATEQAMSDATKIGDILDALVVTEDGDLNNAANRDFIQAFMETVVPESERGGMMTANHLLSKAGLNRARAAGMTVQEYTSQTSLFGESGWFDSYVAGFIESNKRSAKQMTAFMASLYDEVQSYGSPDQISLMGGRDL